MTLTGPGGAGKTRLALPRLAARPACRTAGRTRTGCGWSELAALADPALVPQAVAARPGRAGGARAGR